MSVPWIFKKNTSWSTNTSFDQHLIRDDSKTLDDHGTLIPPIPATLRKGASVVPAVKSRDLWWSPSEPRFQGGHVLHGCRILLQIQANQCLALRDWIWRCKESKSIKHTQTIRRDYGIFGASFVSHGIGKPTVFGSCFFWPIKWRQPSRTWLGT